MGEAGLGKTFCGWAGQLSFSLFIFFDVALSRMDGWMLCDSRDSVTLTRR